MVLFCPECKNLIINNKCSCNSDKKPREVVPAEKPKQPPTKPNLEKLIFSQKGDYKFVKRASLEKNITYLSYCCIYHDIQILVPYSFVNSVHIAVEKENVECADKRCRVRTYCVFKAEESKIFNKALFENIYSQATKVSL